MQQESRERVHKVFAVLFFNFLLSICTCAMFVLKLLQIIHLSSLFYLVVWLVNLFFYLIIVVFFCLLFKNRKNIFVINLFLCNVQIILNLIDFDFKNVVSLAEKLAFIVAFVIFAIIAAAIVVYVEIKKGEKHEVIG